MEEERHILYRENIARRRMVTTLSKHAALRLEQRGNINKKSMDRLVEKVFECGMGIEDTRGELRKYLITISLKTIEYGRDPKVLVHGRSVYIFSQDGTLITTWALPKRFFKEKKPYREVDDEEEIQSFSGTKAA